MTRKHPERKPYFRVEANFEAPIWVLGAAVVLMTLAVLAQLVWRLF